MSASGLGKSSLYGAFGDKHHLFLRVLRDYDEANDRMLREWLERAERGIEVVRGFVTGAVGDAGGEQALRGACWPTPRSSSRRALRTSPPRLAAATPRPPPHSPTRCGGRSATETSLPVSTPDDTARAVLAGQLGLIVLGRIGQDHALLTSMAETLLDRLLPTP